MTALKLDLEGDRKDMLKWISARNAHIPMAELEFLIGIPPFSSDDDEWSNDNWR